MSITSAICNSLRTELGLGLHDFTTGTGNVFKCALYTSAASLNKSTTVYSVANEVAGAGYTAGGEIVTSVTPVIVTDIGVFDFNDLTYSALTVTGIRGAVIYNSTNGNRAVLVLNFGTDQSPAAQDFKITFPSATATTAILRTK
tara:strand:- start:1985 stop:2416 length:432 start_codon:yes stop_codon:yes gene_type:complete